MFNKISEIFNNLSKKLYKVCGNDDSHEFKPLLAEIEDSPVSPLGRTIFWIIISAIIFTCLWMYFGKVDVVISARGKIIPDGEMKILQPLDTGVVENILVKEGDFVKKGQVVMEINPSTIQPGLESAQKNLQHIQLEIERLDAVANNNKFTASGSQDTEAIKTQTDIYISSTESIRKQLLTKEIELKKVDERIKSNNIEKNNYQVLLDTRIEKEERLKSVVDIIAKDEYEKVLNDISTYKANIQSLNHKTEELYQQKQQIVEEIGYIKQEFKSRKLEDISNKQKQATELLAQIKESSYKNTKQKITSPVDGHINSLLIHTIGGVVTPAEKLISIVPIGTPLVIKATVLNKDIGYIKPDMPVSIKVDTFEFQKYGILKAKVKTISKNSIDDEKLGPIYEVYMTPIDKSVVIEKEKRFISPGMSLTAEIKVSKRRVIEFFIYPLIKYWNEGITVR